MGVRDARTVGMNAHLLENEDGPRDGRVGDTNSPWPARRHRRQHRLWRCGGGDALWRIVGLGGGGCSGARIGRQRRRWHRKRERRRERRRRSTWGARSLRWCIHLDAVLSPRAYCSRIVPSWGSFFLYYLSLLRRRVCQLETSGPCTRAPTGRRPLCSGREVELGEVGVDSPRGGPCRSNGPVQ